MHVPATEASPYKLGGAFFNRRRLRHSYQAFSYAGEGGFLPQGKKTDEVGTWLSLWESRVP